MPLDLTNVKGLVNNVKRRLFFEEGVTLKLINFNGKTNVLLELEDGWYLDKNPDRDAASPTFYLLSIADLEGNLTEILQMVTTVKIGNLEYGVAQENISIDATRDCTIKLQVNRGMERDI
jgi:hypothetical protein